MDVIPFNRPHTAGNERAYLEEVLASGHLAGDGAMTRRASALLERLLGASRVLLTTSCTHALELCALLLEGGPGDEVIVPSFTFVSTANAFALRGARLVFADVRPDTLNLDERALPALVTPRTRAIVPVHYAGVACDMPAILAAAGAAAVVEDNAHGLFASLAGRPLGSFGRLASQSFHDTKNVTCGEGGALVINDPRLVERAEILREKGTDRSRFFRGQVDKYTWVDLGSSYLPSELLAAVLTAQLEAAERTQAARMAVWQTYARELAVWAAHHGVTLPTVPEGTAHPAHLFYLLLPDLAARTRFLAHLADHGVRAAFHYQALHLSAMGQRMDGVPGQCPVSERAADTLARLPLWAELGEARVARVIDAVRGFTP